MNAKSLCLSKAGICIVESIEDATTRICMVAATTHVFNDLSIPLEFINITKFSPLSNHPVGLSVQIHNTSQIISEPHTMMDIKRNVENENK